VKPLEPLDPVLADLFRKEPLPEPPALAHARVLARLEASILSPPTAPPSAPARSLPRSVTFGPKALALAASTFVLGAILGGLAVARWRPPAPPRVVYVERPAPVPPNPVPALDPRPADSALAPSREPPVSSRRSAPPSPSAAVDVLTAERLLVDAARTKLATEDPGAALDLLREHERRFPRGGLSEEREALAVQALAQVGQYDAARARAKQLRNRWPHSVFLSAVETTIQSIP
jgi:hypothetical protein